MRNNGENRVSISIYSSVKENNLTTIFTDIFQKGGFFENHPVFLKL